MKNILRTLIFLLPLVSCGTTGKMPSFEGDKIAVVAHRGFWKCDAAGNSENSIASLREAQLNGFWGSECDIHLTSDGKIIVNHNRTIEDLKISDTPFETLSARLLNNGEKRPSFEEYVLQMKPHKKTVLVVEFKKQPSKQIEEELIDKTIACLKSHKMFRPDRVMFISFSLNACKYTAEKAPGFVNQYLNGDIAPKELSAMGINGIDYHFKKLFAHPEWVKEAHDLGMSVNIWTVNKDEMLKKAIELGVDAITTNNPLQLRELLGNRELKR